MRLGNMMPRLDGDDLGDDLLGLLGIDLDGDDLGDDLAAIYGDHDLTVGELVGMVGSGMGGGLGDILGRAARKKAAAKALSATDFGAQKGHGREFIDQAVLKMLQENKRLKDMLAKAHLDANNQGTYNALAALLKRSRDIKSRPGLVPGMPGVPMTSEGSGILGFPTVTFGAASPLTAVLTAQPQTPGNLGRIIAVPTYNPALPTGSGGPIVVDNILVGNRPVFMSGQPVPIEMFAANATYSMVQSVPYGPGLTVSVQLSCLTAPAGTDTITVSMGAYAPTIVG